MRLALLGDIHGNAAALEAVLSSSASERIDFYCVTGDIVGYYYEPKRVLDMLRGLPMLCVRGNHEDMLLRCQTDENERLYVRAKYGSGIDVALESLTKDDISWLSSLPVSARVERAATIELRLAHGSPWDTNTYIYPNSDEEVWRRLKNYQFDIMVLGHTHYQFDLQLAKARVINPGSVGQPRDRKPGASWSILDVNSCTVTHFRTPYNALPLIEEARQRDPHIPYLQTVLLRT